MRFRLSCALILTLRLFAGDQVSTSDEYLVKAAFLCSFAKFVEWPPEAFTDPAQPLAVCVLGVDPFGHALDDVVRDKTVQGRAFAIRRISDARQSAGCRILFVSFSERKTILSVLAAIRESGILMVGESESDTSAGMIINFTLEKGKVRFAINPAAAQRERLRIDSRLLDLAINLKK